MENNQPNPQAGQQQVQIKITEEMLKGVYSNQAMIRHTNNEFIIDFMSYFPGDQNGVVSSRIVLSPEHAKQLVSALQENFKKYEDQFGKVEAAGAPEHKFGFKTD